MISGDVPDDVSVSGSVLVELTMTFPKFSAVALTVSRGPVVAVTELAIEAVAGPDEVAFIAERAIAAEDTELNVKSANNNVAIHVAERRIDELRKELEPK